MGHEIPGRMPHVFTKATPTIGGHVQPVIEGLPDENAYLDYKRSQAKRDRIRSLWGQPVQSIVNTAVDYQIDVSQFGTTAALVEAIADAEFPPMNLPPKNLFSKEQDA